MRTAGTGRPAGGGGAPSPVAPGGRGGAGRSTAAARGAGAEAPARTTPGTNRAIMSSPPVAAFNQGDYKLAGSLLREVQAGAGAMAGDVAALLREVAAAGG